MFSEAKQNRYSLPDRLSDVIALISVLALSKYAFMTEEHIVDALRGKPKSKKTKNSTAALTWKEIVASHHEFFRPNGADSHFALVIRSYFPEIQDPEDPDNSNAKIRRPLTVDETQNLINVAVSLHEKEIDRMQRNSFKVPVIVAIITLVGVLFTVFGVIYTSYHSAQSNAATNQKIDSLKTKILEVTRRDINNRPLLKIDSNKIDSKKKLKSPGAPHPKSKLK